MIAAVAGLALGPVSLSPLGVAAELLNLIPGVDIHSGLSTQEAAIVTQLRLPRVVLGLMVGSMLSLAGGCYQGVFRNPMADPYLLGVFLAYGLGAAGGRVRTPTTLLLAGIAVVSFLTAIQTYILQRNVETIREVYSFILGSLATTGWAEVRLALPYAVLAAVVVLAHRRELDVFTVGDDEATSLGLHPRRSRLLLLVAASLGTAAAVSVAGLIAFVGIIVPHIIRLIAGTSYRLILPLSVLFGGAFLVVSDLLARVVLAPSEIPIGVVTAFLGAPFFVLVLRTAKRVGL